jgi:ABC-type uncharacterized transport system permease subunit
MLIELEPRSVPSKTWQILSPVVALLATVIVGILLFSVLGKSPIIALQTLFISPLSSFYGMTELAVKAAPILLIAVGLAVCFQAKVWNIGAEGQFTIGAISSSIIALAFPDVNNYGILLLSLIAGVLGGVIWGSIPALLKVRFNANEILTSLMLNYVAISLLNYLVRGQLKDPQGFNFPESAPFGEFASLPSLIAGTRLHWGVIFAFFAAVLIWFVLRLTFFGFSVRVVGSSAIAPSGSLSIAAEYAGIKGDRIIWLSLILAGGLAGERWCV